jgi:hypothetical protein
MSVSIEELASWLSSGRTKDPIHRGSIFSLFWDQRDSINFSEVLTQLKHTKQFIM